MGTGVGEMMLMSAAMGGGTAAITGGDPLKGALLGGLTGGLGAGISNAMSAAQPLANAGVSAGANAGQAAINSQLTNTLPSAAANTANAGNVVSNVASPFTMGAPNIASSGAANTGVNAARNAAAAYPTNGIFSNPTTVLSGGSAPTSAVTAAPNGGLFNLNASAGNFPLSNMPRGINQLSGMPQQTLDPRLSQLSSSSLPDSNIYNQLTNPAATRLAGAEKLYPGLDMSKTAYQPKLGGADAVNTGKVDALAGGNKFSLKEFLKTSGKGPSLYDDPYEYIKEHKMPAISAALAGSTATKRLPEEEEYDGPLSRYRFNPATYRPNYFAEGGIAMLAAGGYDRQVGENPYPMRMASGGISDLGSYSDGGRMLRGPGDGMSDSIPASISGKRPARLADGEFVIPADVVSHLGNGSTDAGAKQLYSMMDKVRTARTGKKKQARAVTPQKYMPA